MKKALYAVLALHALRLLLAPTFDLAPQEAYYSLYAQHPALGYFDHPPAIAWILWPFLKILGRIELAPRLAAWLTTLGTGLALAALARRTLPRSRRPWLLLVACTTLMASVVGLIATPDVPLLLFWTLALLFLHRAAFGSVGSARAGALATPATRSTGPGEPEIAPGSTTPTFAGSDDQGRRDDDRAHQAPGRQVDRQGAAGDWLAAGLFMGLAFDSKYTAVFLQLGLLVFLLASPRHRRLLATPWPYVSVLVAHAAMAPVYWWNATHGWASFLFQSAGRASNVGGLGIVNFGKLLGTQAALLLPPLLLAMGWAIWIGLRMGARALAPATPLPDGRIGVAREMRAGARRAWEQVAFLLAFSLPPIAVFGALSLVALVKPNWLMPAYVAGTLLAVRLVPRRQMGIWKWQLGFALPLFALAAVEVLGYAVPIRSDDTWFGWKELARQVEARARQANADFVFADDEYKTTAQLRFYSDLPAYAGNVLGRRALQFDYLGEDLSTLAGKDALFLDSLPHETDDRRSAARLPDDLAARFAQIEEEAPITVQRGGEVQRKFLVYRCRSYRPR